MLELLVTYMSAAAGHIRVFSKITSNTKLAFLPTTSFLLFLLLKSLVENAT